MGSPLPWPAFSSAKQQAALEHLDQLLELGCTAFDTAAVYQAGGTERLLGEWMRSRGIRQRLFLITKGAHPHLLLGTSRFRPQAIAEDLHASLRRLGTERIDLYLLHRDDPGAPLEPVLQALSGFQREGKIGAYGVSNWSHARIQEANEYARSHDLPLVAASSPHFSLLDWVSPPWPGCVSIAGPAGAEARSFHARTQTPVLAWSPLGSGFFSGRALPRSCRKTYGSPANFSRRERAETLARKRGVSAAQVALAYLFHQPFPVSAVVAASTAEKMRHNLEATRLELGAAEVHWLESGEGTPR